LLFFTLYKFPYVLQFLSQQEDWLKGKTKMWDVFPDDVVLDNNVELALANLDLNEPVLEPVTFNDGDTVEGLSSTPANAEMTLDTEEEDAAEESSSEHDDHDEDSDVDYDDED
jgi:hypothetical protein